MSGIRTYQSLKKLTTRLRDDLNDKELVLLYAFNRTGKTRLSMEFKERGKSKNKGKPDTLYFNAFTEDLFTWENDLENDSARGLKINHDSKFFDGFLSLGLEPTIDRYLSKYASFYFNFKYKEFTQGTETFTKPYFIQFDNQDEPDIKISRGEESIFIWCIFMAICERVIDGHEAYNWVKYIYIDDPISSLDDDNAISVACDLAALLRKAIKRVNESGSPNPMRAVVSTHHSLFFNIMYNEISRSKNEQPKVLYKCYFLHRPNNNGVYTLRSTNDTPFFHHIATLSELKKAADPDTGTLYTFHFNALRSIMEKTAAFFGHSDISFCIKAIDKDSDGTLFNRALNLLSHGGYAIHEATRMGEDNQNLFRRMLNEFIHAFQFDLPEILSKDIKSSPKRSNP